MPGSESVVAEGPWAGSTLSELIGRFGAELLGKANYARFGQEFPLLVKFIDAREDLSIQVHPDDFDRRDAAGNSRELHTELAREAIDFESSENSRITYAPENNQEVRLVTTPYFTTSLYTLTARTRCDWSATDSFVAIVLLQGSGSLTDNEGNRIDVRQGETWLLPASTQWTEITPHTAPLRLLTSRI